MSAKLLFSKIEHGMFCVFFVLDLMQNLFKLNGSRLWMNWLVKICAGPRNFKGSQGPQSIFGVLPWGNNSGVLGGLKGWVGPFSQNAETPALGDMFH